MKLFRTFRRHQKVAFALLTLMAMISFVILPIVLDMIQSRGGINPVVIRTKAYGVLHRSELAMLTFQRQKLHAFLQAIYEQVMRARLASSSASTVQPLPEAQRMVQRIGPADEEAVANTWLLAQRARQMGIQVSDAAIRDTLARLLERRVTEKTFRDILRHLQLTDSTLFEYLRHELLALRVEELFNVGLVGTPPAQQWDYFLRMNRKARIEALGVPVADFVNKVPEPSDAEIRELFARYKQRDFDPNSPEPGFRRPHRVAIEYFKAEYSRFVDPSKVTEEQIRQYYEENKDFEFVEPEPPPKAPPEKPAEKPPENAPAKSAQRPAEKPAEKPAVQPAGKPTEKPPVQPAEKSTEKPAQKSTEKPPEKPPSPAPEKPANAAPEKSPGPAPEKKPPTPAEEKPAGPAAPPGTKASATPDRRVVRLVAYHAGDGEKPVDRKPPVPKLSDSKPGDSKPADSKPLAAGAVDSKPGQSKLIESKPAANKPSDSKVVGSKPGDSKPGEPKPAAPSPPQPKAAGEKPGSKAAEPKPSAPASAETKPAQSKPRKYKPLDQVRDQIRMTLAQRAAETLAEEVLQKLEDPLRQYELQWLEHAKRQGAGPAPQRPDLKEWAAKYGITANATGLITIWELGNFDIARSQVDGQRSFAEVAFGPLNLYQRMRSKDVEGNASFLFWKVEDDPERDVELDEPGVREQVVQAWKLRAARPLARQDADRLADEARKAGQSLKQVFASRGMKVIEPEPFSWLTFGFLPPPLSTIEARLSSPAGIDSAGEEFMGAVFALEPGQVGTALNQPQTVAYVVRVVEFLPPQDVLWNDFLKRGLEFSRLVARREIQNSQLAWLDEIKAQAGFEWVEPPRRERR